MLGSGPGDRGSNLTLSFPKRKVGSRRHETSQHSLDSDMLTTVYPKKRRYKFRLLNVKENPRGAI